MSEQPSKEAVEWVRENCGIPTHPHLAGEVRHQAARAFDAGQSVSQGALDRANAALSIASFERGVLALKIERAKGAHLAYLSATEDGGGGEVAASDFSEAIGKALEE